MSGAKNFDAVIIGSGQAGNPLALHLAGEGRQVLLVEKRYIGGTCVNTGCTPSKTFHALAKKKWYAKNLSDKGFSVESDLDFGRMMDNVRDLRDASRQNNVEALQAAENLTIWKGEARFSDKNSIQVSMENGGTQFASAGKFFINTGTSPFIPEIDGLAENDLLTNLNVFEINDLPKKLAVIGGGFIGLEFAQSFNRLGAEVVVIEKEKQILGGEDEDIAQTLREVLEKEGVKILTETELRKVEKTADGFEVFTSEETFEVEQILLTTGRKPNTESLDLQKAGVETNDDGFIQTDEHLQTSNPKIYALGEVAGTLQFTHFSYDDFRVVRSHLEGKNQRKAKNRTEVWTLFTDPQLGRWGLNEKQAKQQGVDYELFTMEAEKFSRAKEKGEPEGLVKVLADKPSGKILGASVLIAEGGELLATLQMAAAGGFSVSELKETIFPHPTLAEGLNNLFG